MPSKSAPRVSSNAFGRIEPTIRSSFEPSSFRHARRQEEVIEGGVVGEHVIGRIGNTFVQMATDARVKQGTSYIANKPYFSLRDIEVINLDGLPETEALRLLGVDEQGQDLRGGTGLPPSAESWQDAIHDPTHALSGAVERTAEGLRLGDLSTAMAAGWWRVGAVLAYRAQRSAKERLVSGGFRYVLAYSPSAPP